MVILNMHHNMEALILVLIPTYMPKAQVNVKYSP